MVTNERFKEILKLHDMLTENSIPHRIREWIDGWQIIYTGSYDLSKDAIWVMDAIEMTGSYGCLDDKIEIRGLLTEEESEYESVVGHLTAEDVYERIHNHWINNNEREN